jgi:TonB family protein
MLSMLPCTARNLRVASFLLFFALPTYAQPPAVVAVHALPPFAITDDTIKPGTKGLDVERTLASALKQQAPVKSEFETNAEFSERLKKFAVRALPAQISNGGFFAVVQLASSLPPLWLGGNAATEITYSPETEVLSVTLDSWLGCLPLRRVTTPKRKYTAKNGFGQQVTVLEAEVSETCIGISDSSPSPIDDISFSIDVSRGDAPKLKPRLAFALIGKAVPPFAKSEDSHDKPTMKQPLELHTRQRSLVMELVDVWLVDIGTGSVLAKHMTPLTNSKPSLLGGFRSINGCSHPSYGKSEVPNFDLVVELAVSVKFDGSITETSVSRSTGIPSLDSRAVDAVSKCKFKPGTKDGQPMDGVAVVKFHFDSSHAHGY